MSKKLTITVSDEVFDELQRHVGRRGISRFFDELARKRVVSSNRADYCRSASSREIEEAYAEAAKYEAEHAAELEREDQAWLDGLIADGLGKRSGIG